jgi:hypothetical protein
MTLEEALDIVVSRTKHGRYRELCDPAHPDYDPSYIATVLHMAEQPWPPDPAEYPSLFRQGVSLAGAVGRVVVAAVKGEPILVSAEVLAGREALCRACEHHDPEQRRCRLCGCHGAKLNLSTERCPIGKWEAATDDRE